METELKNARAEVRRLKQEKESYEQDYHDLTKTKDETHVELKDMRGQLRDFKYRETRCEYHQCTLSLLFFFRMKIMECQMNDHSRQCYHPYLPSHL